jgi:hypothetical protein
MCEVTTKEILNQEDDETSIFAFTDRLTINTLE